MRRHLLVVAAVIAVAAFLAALLIAVLGATPVVSPTQTPTTATTPSPTTATTPNPPPTAALITEQVGRLTVTHPVAWRMVAGPKAVPNLLVPLFYLSDVPLAVGPCPTPDPKTGALFQGCPEPLAVGPCPTPDPKTGALFQGCPEPLSALPADGVLVTISPNFGGVFEGIPPLITVDSPDASCRAVGGEAQIDSATAGTVVIACLRGPDLSSHEAEVRGVIASLKPAS
jgi:hypothetical protein